MLRLPRSAAAASVLACLALLGASRPEQVRPLRVCADPNNLPYSNARHQGFEDKLAELVGKELHRPVKYYYWAQRRGFIRNTLNAGDCDIIMGTAAGLEMVTTTKPYYRSAYTFVSKASSPEIRSLDDRSEERRVGKECRCRGSRYDV